MTLAEVISAANASFETVDVDGLEITVRADGRRVVVSFVPAYFGGDPANGYDDETEAFIGRLNAQISLLGFAYHDSGSEEDGHGEWHVYLLRASAGPKVGDRVEAGEAEDHDTGTVDAVDGRHATVRWDSGVVTPAAVEDLRILD